MTSALVTVRGVGLIPFGKHVNSPLRELAEQAAVEALKDAGIDAGDVDAVFFSNASAGIVTGQESIRGQTALRGSGLLGKPLFNVENACASGSSAFLLALAGIRAQMWRTVLVVGAEKMMHEDRTRASTALAAAADLSDFPAGASGAVFMEIYAERTRAYMERWGTTQEDLAQLVVKARRNAADNPIAQIRKPMTVEEALSSGDVAWPLTRSMCSPISDGAAAVVLGAAGGPSDQAAVEILASALTTGDPANDPTVSTPVTRAARAAYAEAGVGPQEIDVVELHDAASPAELEYCEALELCREGEATDMLRRGDTAVGGRLPVNPSGGLVARGHPIGATGVAQIAEVVLQLRGVCGARQVAGARIGLVQNAGGSLSGFSAAAAVHILRRR